MVCRVHNTRTRLDYSNFAPEKNISYANKNKKFNSHIPFIRVHIEHRRGIKKKYIVVIGND